MRRCLNCMSEYLDQYEDRCPHCGYLHGTAQSGTMELAPGSILQGRYIVGTSIKNRDTDIFYNGWDALFDRRVIIQEYFPKYCAARSGQDELSIYDSKADVYQEGLELFYIQSRELIRFYKEDDIITYHACFQANRTAYAVMEHRSCRTLKEWLNEHNLNSRDALKILHEVIRITEKCHYAGMLHGMIDLDSIWMTGEGRLILKDFGPWRYISGEPGVVGYRNAAAATDAYRLAVMFCQMLTGTLIDDAEKLTAELNRNRLQLKGHEIRALKNALSYDTRDLQTFLNELDGEPMASAYASAPDVSEKRAKRRDTKLSLSLPKWAWAAAGAAMALVLAVTIIGVRRIRLESETGELAQKEVRVPNIVGKDADQMEATLRSMGLKLEREEMDYSDEIDEGMISYQVPAAGAVLEKGDAVIVRISKGKEKAEIPLVKGLDKEIAKKMLADAGFHEVSIIEAPNSQKKYGTVLTVAVEEEGADKPKELVSIIDQFLGGKFSSVTQKKEDNLVALDTGIVLTVSTRALEPEEIEVMIPELLGINITEAQSVLDSITEKELILQPHEEYSDEPAGEIISQKPEAGMKTTESYIEVVVSKGREKVLVANVELMTQDEAKAELGAKGLKIGKISEEYSNSIAKGKIISQSIDADEQVEKGTAIDLVISKGSKPVVKSETKKQTKPKAAAAPEKTMAAQTEAYNEAATEASAEAVGNIPESEAELEQSEESALETKASDGKNAIEAGAKPEKEEIVIEPNPMPTEAVVQTGKGPGGAYTEAPGGPVSAPGQ